MIRQYGRRVGYVQKAFVRIEARPLAPTGRSLHLCLACLIVEDDPDIRDFMQLLLSTSGYETMTAANGEQALDLMRQRKPCIVLLDLMMPVMDGFGFRARQLEEPTSPACRFSASRRCSTPPMSPNGWRYRA